MTRFTKIILALSVIGVGIILYFFFVSPSSPVPPESQQAASASPVNRSHQTAIQQFATISSSFHWLNSKTHALYFLTPEGKVYKTFGDGRDELMSDQTLPDLHGITPSPDGVKIIASFSYPLRETFAIFDTDTNSWERLPEATVAATFDPTSARIAYAQSGSSGGIFILSFVDKKTTDIARLGVLDGTLTWNKPDELLLTQRPSNAVPPEIWSIDVKKKTIKQIADRTSMMYQFSSDGNYGLKFAQPTLNTMQLFLTDGDGTTITKLAFTTLPSKCTFNAQTLYCAIPREFPARAVLPDDYLKEKFFTDDSFVSYQTETGAFTIIAQLESPVDAEELLVRGDQLLFRNRYDEKLYALPLK